MTISELVSDLGLDYFPQNSEGDVIIQRMSREKPRRYRGLGEEPQVVRLAGGTGTLISALAASIPKENIQLNARVKRVTCSRLNQFNINLPS